ncbi:MAG: cell envelope integrity EipB family protein [Alphaproteobacteria bacterium]|nr:cell envelope integrity EipB family protein [Alphaproteobacteria bacterium]MBV9152083.1 cell envelope integrity EipB family protein [Alphaproteobacteria bacterium]MBV9967340.1 cell envelope integrity EipB family protein [Alphaproteobacteria bacterium]
MMQGWGRAVGPQAAAVAAGAILIAGAIGADGARAAEIMPHHALYSMSLGGTHGDAGVTGAGGTMAYQWGEVCDGWTVEQRYRLKMAYAESQDVSISSNFVTWESKDGLKYRFNQKETRNGNENDEIKGQAKLDGPGKGGTVDFEKPEPKNLKLPAGAMFPSAHTIFLIDKAKAGENFISKQIFDGATVENAVLVTAVIGAKVDPDEDSKKKSPLLDRPGWHVRLAFFPADQKAEKPDYELGMVLLDNGVSRDMVIDYGDYSIKATLDDIEALPKPKC